ncbi:MAG: chain length determinant protein EpsF [Rubrivivax sp.]|nr:chain length determinant protein EpsF [Rubrivivax sp.]
MTFGQFLSILRARWWLALAVLLGTVLLTVGASLLMPKQYKAAASVVVDFRPDPLSAAIYGGAAPPALMATQVDIIRSDRVAERVVRNLRLSENPQVRQQWLDGTKGEGSIETWLAGLFQRSMEVEPSRESSVITVAYKSADPRFAAALANAFVQAYVDTSLELRVNPARQYAGFFETRSKEARDALEKAQTRVSSYQAANGIIATDERLDVETARLNELSSQLTAVQALGAETSSRQTQAQGSNAERLSEVLNNPIVGALKADINRGEAQLRQLNTRLGDAHPQVQEARANLAELRQRLGAETARVTGGVTLANTINRQREGQMRADLDLQRAKVLRMKSVRDEGMVMMRDVENAQRNYDAVLARFTQTNLESQTTQSNVNQLTQAVAPLQPSSPRVMLNTILSLVVGTLLAIATVLLLELRNRRVRSMGDAVTALDLPLIGVLPGPGSKARRALPRASALQQRLMAPLQQPPKAA